MTGCRVPAAGSGTRKLASLFVPVSAIVYEANNPSVLMFTSLLLGMFSHNFALRFRLSFSDARAVIYLITRTPVDLLPITLRPGEPTDAEEYRWNKRLITWLGRR